MTKSFDLRQKKVIDVETAEQIGYIRGMDIDFKTGQINSVNIPQRVFFGLFSGSKSIVVPWNKIVAIGREYILIKKEEI